MNRIRRTLLNSLLTIASAGGGAVSADDDIIVERIIDDVDGRGVIPLNVGAKNQVQVVGFVQIFNEAQFERRIFTNDGTEARGRSRIHAELEMAINRIDEACQLTDAQKQKLDLAGRADRKRFLDRVDAAREFGRNWTFITQSLQSEIQSLQRGAEDGLLGPDSFFAKSVPVVLTPDQVTACQRSRRQAFVESLLREIETKVALRASQRESVHQLMRDQVQGPKIFWAPDGSFGDDHVKEMRHRFSLMAEEKVKPLLDDNQWQNLKPILEFSRRLDGQILKGRVEPSRIRNPQ